MSSIYQKPKVKPVHGRNGHDLSRRRMFTSPCGMLLPIFKDFANPGDHYKLNSSAFIRTEALQSAAFMRLRAHVEWFFVPITQLFKPWNEFFNQTNDIHSSIFLPDDSSNHNNVYYLPRAKMNRIIRNFESDSYFATMVGVPGDLKFNLKTDKFGVPLAWNFRRLWDLLGYGAVSHYPQLPFSNTDPDGDQNFEFCLLDFLAYHKIYHSHYLPTDWFKNDPTLYNFDKYFMSTGGVPNDVINRIVSTIHYRPYSKDYFTNIFPNPVFSDRYANSFMTGLTDRNLRRYISPEGLGTETYNGANNVELISGRQSDESDSAYLFSQNPESTGVGFISPTDIRALFALDKLLRVTGSTGSHYDEQTLAHFGYKMPQGISDEAYKLGSQTTDLTINEVVASATTDAKGDDGKALAGSSIGDIAGKGFGSSTPSQDIDFTAPCHGILMAIFSIEPKVDYASMGCEVFNKYSDPYDFYHPEFDNVGMQPMFGVFHQVGGSVNSQNLVGWQYRYSELKTSFDVVNEGFWATNNRTWVGTKQQLFGLYPGTPDYNKDAIFFIPPQYTNSIFIQDFPYFVAKTSASDVLTGFSTAEYATNQTQTDGSFRNSYNNAQHVYGTDNFKNSVNLKCFKTSIMSVHSLPKI